MANLTKRERLLAERIGERLRQRRDEMRLTQVEVGNRIDCHANMVANYEAGRNTPSAAVLWRLSHAMGRSIDWIVKGDEPQEGDPCPPT